MKKINQSDVYAIILAGGVGSRFWPFSRELEPKQFMNIMGRDSLIQETIGRLRDIVDPHRIYIISRLIYLEEIKRQIKKFAIPEENILLEPEGKNTAPAIGLAMRLIRCGNEDSLFVVLPSDHHIGNAAKFCSCLRRGIKVAQRDYLVTLGVRPDKPSTGYGYIETGSRISMSCDGRLLAYKAQRFIEKPSLVKAKSYCSQKRYFWNSGIFIWKRGVFGREMKRYLPDLYSRITSIKSPADTAGAWKGIKPISVDYGILQHSRNIALIPADFSWTDLGSWDALNEVLVKTPQGNIIQADCLDLESRGICVLSRNNRLIATVGLRGLIIADTPDALLVCDKGRSQDVAKIVKGLKLRRRKEHIRHLNEKRPWGSYTVLQRGRGFKVKLVEIEPGKRLSLQSHKRRAEHWVVVSGLARVTHREKTKIVRSNESIYIPNGVRHRLENPTRSTLKIIEVQTGSYLEEDDIKRFDDDFRR